MMKNKLNKNVNSSDFKTGEISGIVEKLSNNVNFFNDEGINILVIGDLNEFQNGLNKTQEKINNGELQYEEFYDDLKNNIDQNKVGFIVQGIHENK